MKRQRTVKMLRNAYVEIYNDHISRMKKNEHLLLSKIQYLLLGLALEKTDGLLNLIKDKEWGPAHEAITDAVYSLLLEIGDPDIIDIESHELDEAFDAAYEKEVLAEKAGVSA